MSSFRYAVRVSALRLVFGLALSLLMASGCAYVDPWMPDFGSEPRPGPANKASLQAEAEQAWKAKNYARSKLAYQQLSEMGGLTPAERTLAFERRTVSALRSNQPQAALEALSRWQSVDPQSKNSATWQDLYVQAITALPEPQAREKLLLAIMADESKPQRLRDAAGVTLSVQYWQRNEAQRALMTLTVMRDKAAARGRAGLGELESLLFKSVAPLSHDQLEAMARLIPSEQRGQFPYTIIQLERARRLAQVPGTQSQARQMAESLRTQLANPDLLKSLFGEQTVPARGQTIALALPLTGAYGEIGAKIVRGAHAARHTLAQSGVNVEVQVINTSVPDWEQNLRNLPPTVRVVGGPLEINIFKEMLKTNLTGTRAFFTFLTSMGDGVEGKLAWRFFSGPEDQIRSLLESATGKFGVHSVAVLYPGDSYGQRMASLFEKEARARGVAITEMEGYPTNDNTVWAGMAGRAAKGGGNAVFLAGDFSDAELIVPFYIYHGGDDKLIMGTTIWAQAIARKRYVELPTFSRAIFPGSWWQDNPMPAALALKSRIKADGGEADFWMALGYDFIRFAVRLGELPEGWTPAQVNERVQSARGMDWAMAPIAWDSQGISRQEMFMFRPVERGFVLLESADSIPESSSTPAQVFSPDQPMQSPATPAGSAAPPPVFPQPQGTQPSGATQPSGGAASPHGQSGPSPAHTGAPVPPGPAYEPAPGQ